MQSDCIQDKHLATIHALQWCPLLEDHEFQSIAAAHFFSDGSGGDGSDGCPATWAFCIVVTLRCGSLRFAGSMAGRVVADKGGHLWIGCESADSTAGEASGLLWAIAWALQLVSLSACAQVSFHFDNLSVGSAVFHDWTAQRDKVPISAAIALRQMLQIRASIEAHHVHSHEGQPWNELADACCASIRDHQGEYAKLCGAEVIDNSIVQSIVGDGAIKAQWMYIHSLPQWSRIAYPVDGDGWITKQRLQPDWSQATPAADIAQHIDRYTQPGQATHGPHPTPKPVLVVTYNALTLRTKRQKHNLARQLTERRVHICGVQESRGKHDCITCVGDYIVLGSASLGKHGCQVWISKTLPFASVGQSSASYGDRPCSGAFCHPSYHGALNFARS